MFSTGPRDNTNHFQAQYVIKLNAFCLFVNVTQIPNVLCRQGDDSVHTNNMYFSDTS